MARLDQTHPAMRHHLLAAITAGNGHAVDSPALADWFWRDTTAGWVLFALQEVWKQSTVPGMQVVATGMRIPRARRADSPCAMA